jgi:hypothetical protein
LIVALANPLKQRVNHIPLQGKSHKKFPLHQALGWSWWLVNPESVMTRLVFVCAVNRFRSVIAHYLFKDILAHTRALDQEIDVTSAGIVSEERIQTLEGEGNIDRTDS